ncbi:POXA3b laccase small subunit [Macrolepiota fuliginosa MF-IS2]|uniref:POXA3b laccase small subunit n=1 Tax=Macrolepiota fuliginosa MF-IS2 TaxID=1400762 RepID=A0A9P6BZL6_9AGAR|nr:POXA3b laccase small subunit [Macrolepiota fuliginosa MF-IS2]
MLAFRAVLAFAAATLAFANPLVTRQATNTNPQISAVLDALSVGVRNDVNTIDTMQANGTATDGTVGVQIQDLITKFNTASSSLAAIPVSAGSTTVQPTNVELSRVFGESLQLLSTGSSGLVAQGTVPTFGAMLSQLDPTVASTTTALNTTLPGSLAFVRILMLDAQQFLVKEGAWPETLAALGF